MFAQIRPNTWGHLATAASLIVDVVVHDGDFEAKMREIRLPDGCDFVGPTIDDLTIRQDTGAVVLSVRDAAVPVPHRRRDRSAVRRGRRDRGH